MIIWRMNWWMRRRCIELHYIVLHCIVLHLQFRGLQRRPWMTSQFPQFCNSPLERIPTWANKWRNWLSSWESVPNSIQISDSPSQSVLWKGKTCCKSIRCICNCCWLLWLGFPTFPRLVLQPWPRKQMRCTVACTEMTINNNIRILQVVLVVGLAWASNDINFGL